MSKWTLAVNHFIPSFRGFLRLLFSHPCFALKLLKVRATYFFTRQFKIPVATPDRFLIESAEELITYWTFFVERECWSREWLKVLLSEPKPVVVDVGANAGLFTHWIWTLRPETKFILFEPLPAMAKKIAQWRRATGASLTLHNKAVSDYSGTATFYASSDNDTDASLKPDGSKRLKLEVPVVTLDSAIPNQPILILKIDVKGFECEVLAGGRQTTEHTQFIIVEVCTEAALERIKKQLGQHWKNKRVGSVDYLFMRE
jgi:FkbM family methyltransferase